MNWKKLIIGTWSWKRPFYSLGAIYILLLLCILLGADALIFKPPSGTFEKPNEHFSEIPSTSGDTISTYYREPAGGMPILLWSHGNAEDLSHSYQLMDQFHDLGFGIMAYDYPGYGLSTGKPTEDGCFKAIEAAYQHLISIGHEPKRIILTGQSVGSGPTCWLATEKETAGVLLISPFLSTFRTLTRVSIFPKDRFLNLDRVKEFEHPLLIIHGTSDLVISHWHAEQLLERAASPNKKLVSIGGAGHNDIYEAGGVKLINAMEDFALEVFPR
ncbi:alpha/beta hydrolase [Akkermansiaceae bacterium]|nr:alpha/beta hydrolase [Akkermansiaceae bacterium]